MRLNQLTIKETITGLHTGKFSVTELVQSCLDQIQNQDKAINACLLVRAEEALAQAKTLDNSSIDWDDKPLAGIPIALKDVYMMQGVRTTAGSNVLKNYIAHYDATVVTRLKQAGAILLGKLNLDAWAHGSSGENSDFGPTKNPWDLTKVAGGSSSGSAAAVAADMCLAASGTDTCGSIRLPASFTGVVGLKPTYGRVSRYGVIAMASSLDSIGHLTKTVWDNAKYLEITAGKDPLDATTPNVEVKGFSKGLLPNNNRIKALTIGIPKEYFGPGLHPQVKQSVEDAVKLLEKKGAQIEEVSLPHTDYGLATYYIIQPSEVSSNLGRYDGIRYGNDRDAFGDEAKRRIMIGTYCLSAGYADKFYKQALKVRTLIIQDFQNAFKKVDVLISPVSPTPAFDLGAKQDPLEMYLSDIYAAPSSLAGIPSLALPCGFTESGLPIGMQIMGPHFSEDLLYQVGYVYEQENKWYERKPKLVGGVRSI